ncbi:hypothetical protein ACNKHR_22765 [Shigella flexneri]
MARATVAGEIFTAFAFNAAEQLIVILMTLPASRRFASQHWDIPCRWR